MKEVVVENELSLETYDKWSVLIGVPLMKQMEIIFPERDAEYHLTMANRYRAIYDHKAIEICPPFPGLKQMLDGLEDANISITIASSKRRALIEPVLEFHQLTRYFNLVVGSLEVSNHKPHPEPVHHIIDKMSIPHEDAVVIGDSTYDLEMARNAGVDGIGVTTGIHSRELLATADPLHIVSGLHEVLPLILNGRMKH
jgi:phosphoglycolate phosphatase